jgi:hypothetical protein
LGAALDAVSVIGPAAAIELWSRRQGILAALVSALWVAALSYTILASISFSGTSIGDGLARRDQAADQIIAVKDRLASEQQERKAITEQRSPASIEQQIASGLSNARVQSGGSITDCKNVTKPASLALCDSVLKGREALAAAQRRDALDQSIREDTERLAAGQAIGEGDAGASAAAAILNFITGSTWFTASAVARARVAALGILPSFAGLLASAALALFRSRRDIGTNTAARKV